MFKVETRVFGKPLVALQRKPAASTCLACALFLGTHLLTSFSHILLLLGLPLYLQPTAVKHKLPGARSSGVAANPLWRPQM